MSTFVAERTAADVRLPAVPNVGGHPMRCERTIRLRIWSWGVALLAWTLSGLPVWAQDAAPAVPKPDFSGHAACLVSKVVTGDAVVVLVDEQETKVKLIGVSAPAAGRPYHEVAERFLKNLLAGESVYLEYDDEAPADDREGPVHAYLYRAPDGLFVNLEIVRQGYGKVATKPPFKHRELFDFYQRKAREAKKGVWQPRDERAAKADRALRKKPSSRPAPPAREPTIFVTRTGKKYHAQECAHLRKSSTPLALSEAKRRGYTPCAHCKPPQ